MQGPPGSDWSWDTITAKPEGTAPAAELEVTVGPKGGQTRWKRAKWSRQGGTRPPNRGGGGNGIRFSGQRTGWGLTETSAPGGRKTHTPKAGFLLMDTKYHRIQLQIKG